MNGHSHYSLESIFRSLMHDNGYFVASLRKLQLLIE